MGEYLDNKWGVDLVCVVEEDIFLRCSGRGGGFVDGFKEFVEFFCGFVDGSLGGYDVFFVIIVIVKCGWW